MTKVSRHTPHANILEWFIANVWKTVSFVDNQEEFADFLKAVLTRTEIIMLAKRLQIAKMLVQGYDYRAIRNVVKVGDPTIARINNNLVGNPALDKVINRLINYEARLEQKYSRTLLKDKYPAYFALEHLLENLEEPLRKRRRRAKI